MTETTVIETKKIAKKIILEPGGFYEFIVSTPQQLKIHAEDEEITLEPGDTLHMTITAPPHPQPKSVALPVPSDERKIA